MKRLVFLQREAAVEAIKGTETVMYRNGVWNSYERRKTDEVVNIIIDPVSCGWGADVYADDDEMYVSIPNRSDMW